MRLLGRHALPVLIAIVVAVAPAQAAHGPEAEVTVGSQDAFFSQNKQNEPWVAVDPSAPDRVAAGANDNIDLELCNAARDTTCPFTEKVGLTGFQGSDDGGLSFVQPTYTGWSARHCIGVGRTDADPPCDPSADKPIGTLPRFDERGLASDGDPITAWGPRPGPEGFSWANGSRLYFSSLTSKLGASGPGAPGPHEPFRGFEAIAVSRTDAFESALGGDEFAWQPPVVVQPRQSQTAFGDKESLWADNAASSPYFGRVYVCWVEFRSAGFGAPEPVKVASSADGGDTWSVRQITEAANPAGAPQGRQGCTVRTDSDGVVYVFWLSFKASDVNPAHSGGVRHLFLARSFDGGASFERPRAIHRVQPCGRFDRVQRRLTFDGIAGARTNSFPIADIANGAPTGAGATDAIALTWCDGPTPTTAGPGEQALVSLSLDKGRTWTAPVDAAAAGHRPDFPAIAISPDGEDLYVVYMDFRQPWQPATAAPRLFRGVVRHAELTGDTAGAFATVHEGSLGDARGSSANGLTFEFLGDYNAVSATRDFAVAVWNDARFAAACPAVDAYRQAVADGTAQATETDPMRPAPNVDCPQTPPPAFGNTDIFAARIVDPTP